MLTGFCSGEHSDFNCVAQYISFINAFFKAVFTVYSTAKTKATCNSKNGDHK